MFGKRKYPLPGFPPNVQGVFRRMCTSVPASEIPDMLKSLEICVDQIRQEATKNPLIQLPLIEALYSRSKFLLEQYEQFSASQQRLIIGAVTYFVVDDDSSPDTALATGFDDDVQVMNHVLEELEVSGMFIERAE